MRISRLINNSFIVLLTLAVSIGLPGAGCDSLSGTDGARGEQGPQGEQGPVGPAGEDGSQMYAGSGAPGTDIGDLGDYYLNQDTGELYGPKDDQGWGSPGIVLMGEDGSVIHSGDGAPETSLGKDGDYYFDQSSGAFYGPKTEAGWGSPTDLSGADGADGQDGSVIHAGDGTPPADVGNSGDYYLDKSTGFFYGPKTESGWGSPIDLTGADGQDGVDGQDGEDGSQIYAGDGEPTCGLGGPGDYYLDQTNYELYGPKVAQDPVDCNTIWGLPVNLKGADGNANVTRYLYSGNDFSSSNAWANSLSTSMGIDSEAELAQQAFIVYLKHHSASSNTTYYYALPGYGASNNSYYKLMLYWSGNVGSAFAQINLIEGTGEAYDQIEIIRIENSNTVDHTKSTDNKNTIIPDDLDTSDYEAVARYYGFDD